MAGLSDIVKGVQRTNELLADNVNANKRTAAMITAFVTGQKANFGDRLEASGEKGKGKTATKAAAPARPVKGSSAISGIAPKPTGMLAKLAGMLGGVGAALKGGIGIAAIGAGIAAFFTALGAGDMALEKMKSTGEWLAGFMGNISGAIAIMIKDGSATALAGVFAAGALFGMVTGPRGKVKSIFGIAAIGAGISAFFVALGVGDALLGEMKTTGEWLGKFIENISGALATMMDSNTAVVAAGLFGASALFGFFSPGGTAKAAFGIAIIGAGIAGFFTALGGGEMALTAMEATGERLGGFMKNIAEGMAEFSGPAGAIMLGLIATGGIFGPAMLGPAIGIAGMGVALGAFFAGIGLADVAISFINKIAGSEPGEGFKNLLVNTAAGIAAWGKLDIDRAKMEKLNDAMGPLFASIIKFAGTEGIIKLTDIGLAALTIPLQIIDKLYGTNITPDGEKKGPLAMMIEGLKPLKDLDLAIIDKLNKFTRALDSFFSSFKRLANFEMTGNFTANLGKIMEDLGAALLLLPALVNGTRIEDDDANPASRLLNRLGFNNRTTGFGQGLKKLLETGGGDLDILQQGVTALRTAIGGSDITPPNLSRPGVPGGNGEPFSPAAANQNFQNNSFTPITVINGPGGDPRTRDQLQNLLPQF